MMAFAAPAPAQQYPNRPIRFIVGFAPGGATDIIARVLSLKLAERLGQQVVVDNRASGGGIMASEITAKAPPDGYTLLMCTISAMATGVSMHAKLPYHPVRDFAPVTLPMFKSMAGVNMVHVPYKGAALALTDLMGGHIQLTFSQPPVVSLHLRGGRVKVLATTGARRSAALPDLPTVAEAGIPGYEATSWQGVVVPAGTPRAIVSRLHAEITAALRSPEIGERLAIEGSEPGGNMPDEFAVFIQREIDKWAKVVRASGLKAD